MATKPDPRMTVDAVIRDVGGIVRSIEVIEADELRIEYIRRDTNGFMRWHFRNPKMCLFWYRQGARILRASISGQRIEQAFPKDAFALYPPGMEIDGEWVAGRRTDYVVVFLPTELVRTYFPQPMREPMLAFHDAWLVDSLSNLRAEAGIDDELSRLSASGWMLQAVARLRRRIANSAAQGAKEAYPAMTRWQIKRIAEYMDLNLAERHSTTELAKVIGISRRHFTRVFHKTFGTSPYRYLTERRIEKAVTLLSESNLTISEIALETGFGSSQHFAATFKTATGRSASWVRRSTQTTQDLRDMA